MSAFLSPIGNGGTPFMTQQGVVLAGGLLYTYLAGSTTPQATWTTPDQSVPNANPIVLNSAGLPAQEVWLQQGTVYKFVLADAQNNTLATYDNISGINDTSVSVNEWLASNLTPTYISATQFSVPGNQTGLLPVGRRIKASVSAGTVYGTITASAFSAVTTITVRMDSGALDNGLSAVSYGILSSVNPSSPVQNAASVKVSASNTNAQSIASGVTAVVGWTTENFDQTGSFNNGTGVFTAPTAGFYLVSAALEFASASHPANSPFFAIIIKNAVEVNTSGFVVVSTATTAVNTGCTTALLQCAAGDTISIGAFQNTGSNQALSGSSNRNFLSITQIA
jgi:hypothetical protein